MNLYLRCLLVIFSRFFRKKISILDTSRLCFRVLPNDLDLYGHMNNGRYLTIMDLGRIDLILRSGLGAIAKKRGWNPLVGSTLMKYRRSLKLFESYELHTRLLCWDEKWVFIEQVFMKNGGIVATGLVKGLFYGKSGVVSSGEVIDALGVHVASPPVPESVQSWQHTERKHLRKGGQHV